MKARTVVGALTTGMLGVVLAGVAGLGIATAMGFSPPDDSGSGDPGSGGTVPVGVSAGASAAATTPLGVGMTQPPIDTDRPLADTLRAGDVLVSYDDLVDYYSVINPTGEAGWPGRIADVDILVVECMADQGFWYDPRLKLVQRGLGFEIDSPFGQAMYGDAGFGDAYRWQDAGCHGAAVEQAGTSN